MPRGWWTSFVHFIIHCQVCLLNMHIVYTTATIGQLKDSVWTAPAPKWTDFNWLTNNNNTIISYLYIILKNNSRDVLCSGRRHDDPNSCVLFVYFRTGLPCRALPNRRRAGPANEIKNRREMTMTTTYIAIAYNITTIGDLPPWSCAQHWTRLLLVSLSLLCDIACRLYIYSAVSDIIITSGERTIFQFSDGAVENYDLNSHAAAGRTRRLL